jgi:hypothetical protein
MLRRHSRQDPKAAGYLIVEGLQQAAGRLPGREASRLEPAEPAPTPPDDAKRSNPFQDRSSAVNRVAR